MSETRRPVWPARDPAQVGLYNALSLRGRSHAFRIGGSEALLRWLPNAAPMKGAFALRVTADGLSLLAAFESLEVLRAHPFFNEPEMKDVPLSGIPVEILAAVAAVLAEPLLAELGEKLGMAMRFEDLQIGEARGERLAAAAIHLKDGEGEKQLLLGIFDASGSARRTAEALAQRIAALPQRQTGFLAAAFDAAPVLVHCSVGQMTLSSAELAQLEVGDILLPPLWNAPGSVLCIDLCSSGRRFARGRAVLREDGSAELETLERLGAEARSEMETEMHDIDDLEVEVAFEIERRRLTVGDLKSLEPGYVFRLSADPDALVTITANGRPVAKGRIVDVGGVVGVEVLESAGSGARE